MGHSCGVFSIPEFLSFVGVRSRNTFYRWQKAGIGPKVVRIGGRRVILRETAEAWLKAHEDTFPTLLPPGIAAHMELADGVVATLEQAGYYDAPDKEAWIRERMGSR